MPLIEDFTDFEAFRRCRDFTRKVGGLIRTDAFKRDLDLVRQIRRASVSILSNFAEGFEREGRQEFESGWIEGHNHARGRRATQNPKLKTQNRR